MKPGWVIALLVAIAVMVLIFKGDEKDPSAALDKAQAEAAKRAEAARDRLEVRKAKREAERIRNEKKLREREAARLKAVEDEERRAAEKAAAEKVAAAAAARRAKADAEKAAADAAEVRKSAKLIPIRNSLELLRNAKKPYALYCAASYWSSRFPDGEMGKFTAKQVTSAKFDVANSPVAARSIRAFGTITVDRIRLKDGRKIVGKLKARSSTLVIIAPTGEDDAAGDTKFAASDIESIDKVKITAEEANSDTIRRLCARLKANLQAGSKLSALAAWGKLTHEFPEKEYRKLVSKTLRSTGIPESDAFMGTLVSWASRACPECVGGDKQKRCPTCKGKGTVKVEVRCPKCTNMRCPTCGQRRRLNATCPSCGDLSLYRCRRCLNSYWRDYINRAPGRLECQKCRGTGSTGTMTIGPFAKRKRCTKCKGRGWIPCADCKGKGHITCPRCKNTEKIKVDKKCPECTGKKKLACALCQGTGIRLGDAALAGLPETAQPEPVPIIENRWKTDAVKYEGEVSRDICDVAYYGSTAKPREDEFDFRRRKARLVDLRAKATNTAYHIRFLPEDESGGATPFYEPEVYDFEEGKLSVKLFLQSIPPKHARKCTLGSVKVELTSRMSEAMRKGRRRIAIEVWGTFDLEGLRAETYRSKTRYLPFSVKALTVWDMANGKVLYEMGTSVKTIE